MLEAVINFVVTHAPYFWVLSVALSWWLISLTFWGRDFWMANGLFIGNCINRLSKNENTGYKGWMVAEEDLCGVYKKYVPFLLTKDEFNQRIEYMKGAGDLGRSPTPMFVYILLFVLVAAESVGFAYLLGTVAASEGSSHIHELIMYAIMFVLAVIMPFLMHSAGHQLYRTKLLEAHHKDFQSSNRGDGYSGATIALNDEQFGDAGDKPYTRCLRRVAKNSRDKGSYALVIIAIAAIALIFGLSTWMRIANFQTKKTQESAQMQTKANASNPFDMALPDEVQKPQQQADAVAVEETNGSEKQENLAGFLMLGFIFVFTQIVGVVFGYKYGFVGLETYPSPFKKTGAYADTRGFTNYETYRRQLDEVIDHINSRLKNLQNKLKDLHGNKHGLNKSFRDYLLEKQSESESPMPASSKREAPSTVQSVQEVTPTLTIDQAKADIEACIDTEAEKAYFSTLDNNMKVELSSWLKQRKQDKKAALAISLEELF
jgi:hypothetical protein